MILIGCGGMFLPGLVLLLGLSSRIQAPGTRVVRVHEIEVGTASPRATIGSPACMGAGARPVKASPAAKVRPVPGRGTGDYFVAVFGTSGVSFGAGRRLILEPSQTSGSYLRPTTRSFIGISALSVILMCSGQTSVQHLVMLQ